MPEQYAVPKALASTDWVAEHLADASVRIVEVDSDPIAYNQGHVRGAVRWDWSTQLCDTVVRDIVPRASWEELLATSGIDNHTTVVVYGDKNNLFAAWAFWQLKVYGHGDVRLLDGGRRKWVSEGRDLSTNIPTVTTKAYTAKPPDLSIRAFLREVQMSVLRKQAIRKHAVLVDARSPREFTGELLAPPGLRETCQRSGHIPGARSAPSGRECHSDGTFKNADELREIYKHIGLTPAEPIIVYCRIGERSSQLWFVLKYLLGFPRVKNYDGSWTEWGNLVGAPIERA
jgi:thiosulfate/3-mercaptopyruvate sulfurtransferase